MKTLLYLSAILIIWLSSWVFILKCQIRSENIYYRHDIFNQEILIEDMKRKIKSLTDDLEECSRDVYERERGR